AIEYIGRADFQVKIRGFRIELGEIENAIRLSADVGDCVVIAREDIPGDKRLVAYVVVTDKLFSPNTLLVQLKKSLPDYMIPSAVVPMDSFPLSANGKLDRKALPKPGRKRPELKQNFSGAVSILEKQFEAAWCSVLGYDTVGIDDNFYDLGGNSFLAIQVLQFLKDVHGIELPVIKMFELPTIRKLAQYYGEKDKVELNSMETAAMKNPDNDAAEFEDDPMMNAVAIIGMSGRFPGAPDLDTFWKNLCEGVESVKQFSREELLEAGVPQERIDNPHYIKSAPIIDDVECFDAAFFGYNSEDASVMDPQHRLFMEACWSALEDAGYNPEEYSGKIGVFAGCSMNFYFLKNVLPVKGLDQPLESFMAMIGNERDYIATKVSYTFNLTGPGINVQTGCSTALVGVHLACQSLLNYECDMALAGAATVRTPQKEGYFYTEGMLASKDGHCRTFDEHASGTIFGEGVGVVLLKRYHDALKDGDPIDAVILGTAINNDGSLKVGYTAPSVNGQRDVIESAYAMANVNPQDISYIEAHGTGTLLGDPIEVRALTEVFGQGTEKHCAIGSLKPNIGHLDAAAGIAGLIKTVLVLKYRKIPPVINITYVNPKLELDKTPFYINTECIDLQPSPLSTDKTRLLAGVSSFGVGGNQCTRAFAVRKGDIIISPTFGYIYYALFSQNSRVAKGQPGEIE
ncbi:MAG TPA: beta-ketoacyl synthase N-terminal-like domain-containing protein, partial [Chitinispirillaceae bacterium]|nr:beta-ketoacyl synthase N-terminal-like domain-containing protein [Chitinispirillaceae bacterium]